MKPFSAGNSQITENIFIISNETFLCSKCGSDAAVIKPD
jgi:hypothetical protein